MSSKIKVVIALIGSAAAAAVLLVSAFGYAGTALRVVASAVWGS
jgi:hypothetical protein